MAGTNMYLANLEKRGITAAVLPNGNLWLGPKAAITDTIRRVVREHKAEIIAEIKAASVTAPGPEQDTPAVLTGTCSSCGASVALHPYKDGEGWHWYECEKCGDCRTQYVPADLSGPCPYCGARAG